MIYPLEDLTLEFTTDDDLEACQVVAQVRELVQKLHLARPSRAVGHLSGRESLEDEHPSGGDSGCHCTVYGAAQRRRQVGEDRHNASPESRLDRISGEVGCDCRDFHTPSQGQRLSLCDADRRGVDGCETVPLLLEIWRAQQDSNLRPSGKLPDDS